MFKLSLKPWPISLFTSCFFTVIPLLGLSQHLGVHDVKFYKLSGQALVGNVTATRKVKDYFDCTFFCLELGPFACLSFNFGNTQDNGYYTCELNNSERYLEPHRIQDRQSFDYYGTTTEDLLRFLPCVSSPCNYAGTCTHGPRLGEFSCKCGIDGTVIPFDHRRNVDFVGLMKYTRVQGVFHARSMEHYALNYYDAQRLCEIYEATLATYDQLYAAWEAGLERCSLGWLADGTARYSMQHEKPGCGDAIGILGSPALRDKITKFNAWCYKE